MSPKDKERAGGHGRAGGRGGPAVRGPLWPFAVQWYVDQGRLAVYGEVRLARRGDGQVLLVLPEVGEVRVGASELPGALLGPATAVAAAVPTHAPSSSDDESARSGLAALVMAVRR